ncbi:MAG: 6,7-dimethyl-8-ribityllumazine synthase [Alphaproteobacteria bacterium]
MTESDTKMDQRVDFTSGGQNPPMIMIILGEYYSEITAELLKGAVAEIEKSGAKYLVYRVPGAFEIPAAIRYAIRSMEIYPTRLRFNGYVALGCVIEGETKHFDVVVEETARALQQLAITYSLALGHGVIAARNMEQALERAKTDRRNIGAEAAKACLQMIQLKLDFKLFPRLG